MWEFPSQNYGEFWLAQRFAWTGKEATVAFIKKGKKKYEKVWRREVSVHLYIMTSVFSLAKAKVKAI